MAWDRDANESGVAVVPRLPVPPARRGEPRQDTLRPRGNGKRIALIVAAAIAGGALVWFVQPIVAPDHRIAGAEQRAEAAEAAAKAEKQRADTLEKSLDTAAKGRRDAEARLAVAEVAQHELAGKTSDEASRRKAAEAVQAKLKATGAGAVTIGAGELHLEIAGDRLFKPGDDALTERGAAVLAKVAAVLAAVPDRSVWVQGHTDEQLPAAKPAPAKKGSKPAPVAPRFATTWELSAARALAVVHYLQDVARLAPARLAAQAFGHYAPAAKRDRAASRRIELVVGAPRGK